jgi:hypothetical protein
MSRESDDAGRRRALMSFRRCTLVLLANSWRDAGDGFHKHVRKATIASFIFAKVAGQSFDGCNLVDPLGQAIDPSILENPPASDRGASWADAVDTCPSDADNPTNSMGLVTDCVREPCPQLGPELQRDAASPQQGAPPFVAAAPPQAPVVPQPAPLAASPGAALEAQRKELTGRPKPAAAYLKAALSQKGAIDKKVLAAQEQVKLHMAALQETSLLLEASLDQQSSIAAEFAAVYVKEVFTLGNASST